MWVKMTTLHSVWFLKAEDKQFLDVSKYIFSIKTVSLTHNAAAVRFLYIW